MSPITHLREWSCKGGKELGKGTHLLVLKPELVAAEE
jgi:hypothetical protein